MKKSQLFPGFMLLAVSALSAAAAFQSAQLLPDSRMPQYPSVLTLEGITRGRAVIAVSIDADGWVRDTLPLAYSNIRFARVSVEALKEWRFAPALSDGQPVSVQTEIRFDYTVEGAVISSNITNHFLFDRFDGIMDSALVYRPGVSARLDGAPERISGDAPKYATAAAKDGVGGRVRVQFYIDEKGDVRQPATLSGVHPYLAEQAVTAVRGWKFKPVTSHGQPVLVLAAQEFNFSGDR